MDLSDLPFTAWLCIGFIVILLIVTNLSLVNSFIHRNRAKPGQNSGPTFDKMSFTDQWRDEDRQYQDLAQQAEKLRNSKDDSTPSK